MPKVFLNQQNRKVITLQIDTAFIAKYNLEVAFHDTILVFDNFNDENNKSVCSITFDFPVNGKHSEQFLTAFLTQFSSLLTDYHLENFADRLLFLVSIYKKLNDQKDWLILKDKILRQRGKLLLNLIKAPLPKYTLNDVHKAFYKELNEKELNDIDRSEIQEQLLAYLNFISQLPDEYFLDDDGWIDWNKVDEKLQQDLFRKVLINTNISITLSNGNCLIVSNEIKTHFQFSDSRINLNFSTTDHQQNQAINELVVNQLLTEQKENETEFYKALLEHDFFSTDYHHLNWTIDQHNRKNHFTFNLKSHHTLIMDFLNREDLLTSRFKVNTSRKRNEFIFQYFAMVGLISNKSMKPIKIESTEQIDKELMLFKAAKAKDFNYANTKFSNAFKNLKRVKKKPEKGQL